MSLYAIGQRVWCKSQDSLGFITEARYVTYGGKRKAEYVIELVTGVQRCIDGEWVNERVGRDWMCGSKDLRAADWCCEQCGRYLPGRPHQSDVIMVFGVQDDRFDYCFLCINMLEASKEKRDMADAYGWSNHP